MIQPRPYQIEANNSIFGYFENGGTGNPILAIPTGCGKSVNISMFLMTAFYRYPHQKALVLTHVKELIVQNFKELVGMWPQAPAGINSAGLNQRDFNNKIIFAGIASIHKSWEKLGRVDLIIVDECHLLSPNDETMYQTFIKNLLVVNPYLKIIGFTATPYRSGQGLLTDGGIFTDFCYDITGMNAINRLIAEGYMSPLIPKQTNLILDTSNVKMGADGDYAKGQLQIAVDRYEITLEALKEAINLGHDRKHWLIFGTGIEHCDHIVEILTDLGITACSVHSKIGSRERDQNIEDFKTGKIRAIVNNNVLTTGFNFKPIDLIIVLRPTTSVNLWVQLLGRGTRPSPETGKENCLVLDFAGNTRRLGPINDPVIPRKKGTKAGTAPVKLCNACNCYNHASARFCAYCDAEFTMTVKINVEAGTGELIKGDLPVIETFKIDHITYSKHTKLGSKPSLKVSYYSGLRLFTEYVCVEHVGYAKNKANLWWQERAGTKSPDAILNTMYLLDSLRKPSHVRVWTNKKYPEIIDCLFTEVEIPSEIVEEKPRYVSFKEPVKEVIEEVIDDYDDSIPFGTSGGMLFDNNEFPF
jgi:DNA repair protein RadD